MKVLLVIPYLAAVYGGPSKVVQEIAESLSFKGVDVDLVTTNANGANKLEVPLDQWVEQDGYRVKYFDCLHRYDSILSVSLGRWMAKHATDYDVVHTNNMFAPTMAIARWICHKKGIPYITTPHGMLEPWALSYKSSKKRLYYKHFEVPTLTTANAIHVLNQLEAQNVNTLGFHQTEIIPNGIHQSEFEILPAPELFYQSFPQTKNTRIILFLGRIDPKKGLDLLAPAFAKAHQQFPDTHLVVAGPDSIGFLPEATRYFSQASCLEAVTFTGMLSGELKHSALSAASVYVSPSYSEGFSMSILEGMAAGLPCVITEKCNFPEAATKQAAQVVKVDADAIADSLQQVLQHPHRSIAMGKRARELVLQQYTWDCAANKLVKLYQSIIEPSHAIDSRILQSLSAKR